MITKLSKLTILEMLEKQSEDVDKFVEEMNLPYLNGELRELNAPIRLLINWLTDELQEEN